MIGEPKVDSLLKYESDQGRPLDDALYEELGRAIDVVPRHVFGDHDSCVGNHPLCTEVPQPNEDNLLSSMKSWGFLEEIEDAIRRLSIHADSLLLNLDITSWNLLIQL